MGVPEEAASRTEGDSACRAPALPAAAWGQGMSGLKASARLPSPGRRREEPSS